MFQFLFKSLEINGASVTTLINFISNNLVNVIIYDIKQALNGYYFLNETLSIKWVFGMLCLMIGVLIIS